jgi:hypothetical protein
MPPVGEPDAPLLRFQADIEIRYETLIVNVKLSKNDTSPVRVEFARMNPDG